MKLVCEPKPEKEMTDVTAAAGGGTTISIQRNEVESAIMGIL